MPIIKPKLTQIAGDAPDYKLSIALLDEKSLTLEDEELISALARYKPLTLVREGDLVMLPYPPRHLVRRMPLIPKIWKVRFVVSQWALSLMEVVTQAGNGITLSKAQHILHHAASQRGQDASTRRTPVFYAHGYPHGLYPNSATWLMEHMVRPLMYNEENQPWEEITEEARTDYAGYDTTRITLPFTLDYAPDNYSKGQDLRRPFRKEEPLVNTLCLSNLEEEILVPHMPGERRSRAAELHRDAYAPTLPSIEDDDVA